MPLFFLCEIRQPTIIEEDKMESFNYSNTTKEACYNNLIAKFMKQFVSISTIIHSLLE